MTVLEIIELAKADLGVGANVQIHTPDSTILTFLKQGVREVSDYFPIAKVETHSYSAGTDHITLDTTKNDVTVLEVAAIEPKSEDRNFGDQDVFSVITGWINYEYDIEDFVRIYRNLRSIRIFYGQEFDWHQSSQDPKKIYMDDAPVGVVAATVKYMAEAPIPSQVPPNAGDSENIDYPSPQDKMIYRFTAAKLKQAEGRTLRRVAGGQSAVQTDGAELVTEGTNELDSLREEIKQDGYSMLGIPTDSSI